MLCSARILGLLATFLWICSLTNAKTASSGCGKSLPAGVTTGNSTKLPFTTSSGSTRSYLLHIPSGYQPNVAHGLIFAFHGRGKNGKEEEGLSQFSNSFFNPHMLAVYPDGINSEWQGDPDAKTDDVGFTLELTDHLASTFCLDEDQLYAAGKSNGGGFSANVLACDPRASTRFAAFAGISGAYYQNNLEGDCNGDTVPIPCNPGRKPVPVFTTHGSADPVIPYLGGSRRNRCLPSIPHFMTEWAVRNGVGSHNVSTSSHGVNVIQYDYGTSDGHAVDTHIWIKDLAHQWPSTVPNDDGGATYFNATERIMEFFSQHTLWLDMS